MELIRVLHRHEDGRWWAESLQVCEWSVAAHTSEESQRLAEESIPCTLERADVILEHLVPAAADS